MIKIFVVAGLVLFCLVWSAAVGVAVWTLVMAATAK